MIKQDHFTSRLLPRPTHLSQYVTVFFVEQIAVGLDVVQVVFGCDVIKSAQFLSEYCGIFADHVMRGYHVTYDALPMLIRNQLILKNNRSVLSKF